MLRNSALFATGLVTAVGSLAAGEAAAQTNSYTPTGIGMGGFRLYPILDLGVGYTSNVFASPDVEESDLSYTITPSLRLASEWSTHALNFYFSAPAEFHNDFDNQNTLDLIGRVDGQLDVSRSFNLKSNLAYVDGYESLADAPSIFVTEEPVHYTQFNVGASAEKTFNRLMMSFGVAHDVWDYDDELALNGPNVVEQDDRDHTVMAAAVRAGYSISPATSFFVEGGYKKYDYDLIPPSVLVNRDSDGYEAVAGVAFEISNIITGEMSAGYLRQSYDQPGIPETDGLAAHATVKWQPDALVNVTFDYDRTVEAAGATAAVSSTRNRFDVALDYAFRRNIDVGLAGMYRTDEYTGIDREDDRWNVGANAAYYFNRGFGIYTAVTYEKQSTAGLDFGRDFDINRAEIGIRLRR